MEKYKQLLEVLRGEYGRNAMTDDGLDTIGKSFFGKAWGGVHPHDKVPVFKKKTYFIANTDDSKGPGIHWVGGMQDGKKMYIYDSFGRRTRYILPALRDRLVKQGFKIVESDGDPEQVDRQSDCGLRCIAWLLVARKEGINDFLH
jgi:hypothetical protein